MRRYVLLLVTILFAVDELAAQNAAPPTPTVTLTRVDTLILPGGVDSNSPVAWARVSGRAEMHVLTSINGRPSRATGNFLRRLDEPAPVTIEPWPGGGVWMEAIVKDRDAWYGFYHNENQATMCGRSLNYPRIGMARSTDAGATWTDLGIILEQPAASFDCRTINRYFVGGYGDLSAMLDRDSSDVYVYFSQYGRSRFEQGIGVARLAWADRDAPLGKLMVWSSGVWLPGEAVEDEDGARWVYPAATALVTPTRPWHDADPEVNAFWGPSLHWNAYLQQYVMLLNRAHDEAFGQEGTYISFNHDLADPRGWSTPSKILDGGTWYPQVVGLEFGRGSDTWAGRVARFFMTGRSDYFIEFSK